MVPTWNCYASPEDDSTLVIASAANMQIVCIIIPVVTTATSKALRNIIYEICWSPYLTRRLVSMVYRTCTSSNGIKICMFSMILRFGVYNAGLQYQRRTAVAGVCTVTYRQYGLHVHMDRILRRSRCVQQTQVWRLKRDTNSIDVCFHKAIVKLPNQREVLRGRITARAPVL